MHKGQRILFPIQTLQQSSWSTLSQATCFTHSAELLGICFTPKPLGHPVLGEDFLHDPVREPGVLALAEDLYLLASIQAKGKSIDPFAKYQCCSIALLIRCVDSPSLGAAWRVLASLGLIWETVSPALQTTHSITT